MEIVALMFILLITALGSLAVPVSIKKHKMTAGAGVLSLIFSALTILSAVYLYVN